MRTTGTKGPSNGATPVDGTEPTEAVEGTEAVGGVAPTAAPAVEPTAASGATLASDAVGQVAARLRSGEITVDQAIELLIDDAIERQVGRAVQTAKELEPQLRELLRGYAASDPFLAAKIRRLTFGR